MCVGEEVQVAAAILDLFHMLSRNAVKFLETTQNQLGLVVLTIQLEEKLGRMPSPMPSPRIMSSPYREPLTRFLNKYPAESVAYFLEPGRMRSTYFSMFLDILHMPLGNPLLQQVAGSEERLLALLSAPQVTPQAAEGQPGKIDFGLCIG